MNSSLLQAFEQGLLITSGLIIAIGAQNAYVLKQGLKNNHILAVILICFLCDCLLISLGVLGFGSLISQHASASLILALIGALFLFIYGLQAFISAIKGSSALILDNQEKPKSLLAVISTTLAITLLNPHVYLDTVVIMGGIASTLSQDEKYAFLAGALMVSAIWFFGLGFGARLLVPIFSRPTTWQFLDIIIGLIMWGIALSLLVYAYGLLVG